MLSEKTIGPSLLHIFSHLGVPALEEWSFDAIATIFVPTTYTNQIRASKIGVNDQRGNIIEMKINDRNRQDFIT